MEIDNVKTILDAAKAPAVLPDLFPLGGGAAVVAIPPNYTLKELDFERFNGAPRRVKATAALKDADSFLAYVADRKTPDTNVWCEFDALSSKLAFTAVFNEHGAGSSVAGWRDNTATFRPEAAVEWKTWLKNDSGGDGKEVFTQLGFAEFIEENLKDINNAGAESSPTAQAMQAMALQFEANAERVFKSKLNPQSGGVDMIFVDGDNAESQAKMKVFSRFQIVVPVFRFLPKESAPMPAWPLQARLKYRVGQGKVSFWYELIRPDVVYELAALALIDQVRTGLGGVPLRMGSCN